MIYATREILNGTKILDVAIEYGWESHSGFIKAFKSYYGFSPSLLYACLLYTSYENLLKMQDIIDKYGKVQGTIHRYLIVAQK